MDIKDISTQLLYTTFPIEADLGNGSKRMGTSFAYNFTVGDGKFAPFIITNRHVIAGAKRIDIKFANADGNGVPQCGLGYTIYFEPSAVRYPTDANIDLAGIPLVPALNRFKKENWNVFYRSISSDLLPSDQDLSSLSAIEEVTFIGYPSGIMDQRNRLPIVRRGITATPAWNDYDGKPEFLIDAGVYPGSSGSPVFIYNHGTYVTGNAVTIGDRLMFMGIVSQTKLKQASGEAPAAYLGLGTVIKGSEIKKFVQSAVALVSAAHDPEISNEIA